MREASAPTRREFLAAVSVLLVNMIVPINKLFAQTAVKSGLFVSNKVARITLKACEEIMGINGLKAVLNLAGLEYLIDEYPPDNLEKAFDFADFTALFEALENMYGPRGGRGIALRTGRATFVQLMHEFGSLAGTDDLAFKVMPLSAKLRISVLVLASIFNAGTDQVSNVYEETDNQIILTIERCPVCWWRRTDHPVHYWQQGIVQAALQWVSGGSEFSVEMTSCIAMGDEMGRLVIHKDPIS